MYKLTCKKCGCDREFKNEKSIKKAIKLNRELCYSCNRGRSIPNKALLDDAIEFYRQESIRQGVSIHKIDTSKFPPNIPKDPPSAYKSEGFQWSMVTSKSWPSIKDAILFYKSEVERQGVSSYSKIDKSTWNDFPKCPQSVYANKGFKWSDVTGITIDRQWVTVETAIEFYKSETERQSTLSISNLEKSDWPINIPKSPSDEYEKFKWSDVTGNIKGHESSKATRIEIARLIVSYDNMIDNFDDTLIAMLLSQLVEKAKISKLVAGKVKRLILSVVNNNEEGQRKEKLEALAKEISETENHSEMFNISEESTTNDVDDDVDDVDDDLNCDGEIGDPIELSKERIKARSKAMAQAALNDDFTADFRELMKKNALKYMWYLEFMD